MLVCCMLRGNCSSRPSLVISTSDLRFLHLYTFIGCDVYGSYFLVILCSQFAYDGWIHLDNRHWLVPRQVNAFFTGRKEILQTLRAKICDTSQEERPRQKRFVIVGMGGIGKSEVCLKFAEDARERYVFCSLTLRCW